MWVCIEWNNTSETKFESEGMIKLCQQGNKDDACQRGWGKANKNSPHT